MIRFSNLAEQSYALKESLRACRTNIQFLGDDIKTIVFTSTVPNEGKSTLVMELARSIGDSGKKILVIDADIRKSVLIGRLMAKNDQGREILGLSHYLSGQRKLEEVLYPTEIPGVSIIFAGPSVVNPTEIIEKKYFTRLLDKAKEEYDYVLIDSPPLGAAIDAAVIAQNCDGAVLVVAQDMVNTRDIASARNQLEASGVRILGAILNKVQAKTSRYGYGSYYGGYYGSYYGSYYGNEQQEDTEEK